MSNPLLPCPFCNAAVQMNVSHSPSGETFYSVTCENRHHCKVILKTRGLLTWDDAVEAWNKRADIHKRVGG